MSRIRFATAIANRPRSGQSAGEAPFMPANAALSPATRQRVVESLRQGKRYDVVVIGAGVTGAGVALDAATRGLSVLLVDKQDLAFGTSRWSSKLAHGGLRYLATGNVGIAHRSARERGILMEVTAPHLTHALPQVVPVMDSFSVANRVLPRLAFIAGDALRIAAGTSGSTLPRSRTVSAATVAKLCPAVPRDKVRFGYVNYDGQLIDDAALVTALARTAAGYGADVLLHANVDSVDTESGSVSLQVSGAKGEQESLTVHAEAIVNATGVWAGGLCPQVSVRPSRGTHLVVDAERLGNPTGALTVPVPGATNRFCFILPTQLGRCYIGLTDEPAPTIEEEPTAPEEDVRWILNVVNQALEVKLTEDDVIGTFAGLRPLVHFEKKSTSSTEADDNESTADLSREHVILRDGAMLTVTGGKLTEYRLMAEQTVDQLVKDGMVRSVGRSVTATTPLVGARDDALTTDEPVLHPASSFTEAASSPAVRERLHRRYGNEATHVVSACLLDHPLKPVAEGTDVTRAEFSWAVTHEGAMTVADILDRRTRLGLVPEQRAAAEATAKEALEAAHVLEADSVGEDAR